MEIPLIGLGTWELRGSKCLKVVQKALEIGYRHFDTASSYENHKEIGQAIHSVSRHEVFITSKIWIETEVHDESISSDIEKACDRALTELGIDYLDLYLIHWPSSARPMDEMMREMEVLKEKGKVKEVGVSNFAKRHLHDLYTKGLSPAYNQVEFHPFLYQKELLQYARSYGTNLIAFRPFGKGNLPLDDPIFVEIAEAYNKTAAQIVLKWIIQKNIPVIPKASSEKHLRENFDIFDFELTPSDISRLDDVNKDFRYCETKGDDFDY